MRGRGAGAHRGWPRRKVGLGGARDSAHRQAATHQPAGILHHRRVADDQGAAVFIGLPLSKHLGDQLGADPCRITHGDGDHWPVHDNFSRFFSLAPVSGPATCRQPGITRRRLPASTRLGVWGWPLVLSRRVSKHRGSVRRQGQAAAGCPPGPNSRAIASQCARTRPAEPRRRPSPRAGGPRKPGEFPRRC